MADQIGVNHSQQKLIGSDRQTPRQPAPRRINRNEDSIVVNASEKRYLWTARS